MFLFKILGLGEPQSTNATQHSKQDESFVTMTAKLAIPKLMSADHGKHRSTELRTLGKHILSRGNQWPQVGWRQFALMHNSSIIGKTSFEGGAISESIIAWKVIFDTWQSARERPYFNQNLSPMQVKAVCLVLEDMSYFCKLLPPLCLEPMDAADIKRHAEAFLRALKKRLNQANAVYLPFGYRHGISNEGHAIPCKFQLNEEGDIIISPLNLGEGSSQHPVLNYTTSQEKISFRFYPIKVRGEVFWGKMGLNAFCHMMRYQSDPPHPSHLPYQGEDIYDIFQTLGTVIPDLGKTPEQLEAKGQRAPSCTEKGIKNVVHDVLLDHQVSPQECRKVFLNVYFCSLIAGYQTYIDKPTYVGRHLLKNAAEEMGITLEKLKETITQEEYLGATAVILEIKKTTKVPIPHPSTGSSMIAKEPEQQILSFPKSFPKVDEAKLKAAPQSTQSRKDAIKSKSQPKYYNPTLEIHRFSEQLDEWMTTLDEFSLPNERFHFFSDCMRALPIPEWKKEDIWDKIPPVEVKDLLRKMERLLKLGLHEVQIANSSSEFFWIDQLLAVHTLYVVADKLARKCPWTKLDKFASPFIPHVYEYLTPDFTSIPLGADHHRYARISKYFSASNEEASNRVIFPIEPTLSVEKFSYEATHFGKRTQGKSHIEFLRQHLYNLYPLSSNSQLPQLYIYLWQDKKGKLPSEIHSLYYFVFVASSLFFNSGKSDSLFPMSLKFNEDFDDEGKQALIIETYGKKIFDHHPKEVEKTRQILDESRFNEMAINNHECFDIFDPYYRNMTTNQAVCARLSEEAAKRFKISEAVYRDLLRITRNHNLKVPLALHWASMNLIHLSHRGIQKLLDHCFFSHGNLYDRLKAEPKFIESLQDFIFKSLNYFKWNPHHLSTILFLTRTGICFETHYIELYGSHKKNQDVLLFYKEGLEKLLSREEDLTKEQHSEVLLHWIFVQTQRSSKERSEEIDLLKAIFKFDSLNLYDIDYRWLRKKVISLARQYAFRLKADLSNPSFRNHICNSLLQGLLPEISFSLKEAEWNGDFPCYSWGEYTINILQRWIGHRFKGHLTDTIDVESVLPEWKKLSEVHGSKFWEKEGQFESLDGKLQLEYTDEGILCKREIQINGEKRWARIHHFRADTIDALNLDFLNYTKFLPYTHYVLLDSKPDDPDVITFNYEADTPAFRMDYTPTGAEITSLDPSGRRLPVRMANLSEIQDKNHLLYKYALRFSHPSRILCFINTETGLIDTLNFFYLRLQFKRAADGLESVQYPGFYLQLEETSEELNHYPAVMLITSLTGEQKAIVPALAVKSSSKDFSTEVVITKDCIGGDELPYYLFEVDIITGTLHNKKMTANLYLALILKMQRDEVKALKYLKNVKATGYFEFAITYMLERFTHLRDRSPASLAFNAKLVFLIIDNLNLMLEARFGDRKHEYAYRNLLRWSQEAYIDYLKALSGEELSAIPKELRLSYEEEKAILRTLKRKSEEKEIGQRDETTPFPQLLALRYELLCVGKEKITARIENKNDVKIRPLVFDRLKKPRQLKFLGDWVQSENFPYGENRLKKAEKWENFEYHPYANRFTVQAVEAYFPTLYECAKRCVADLPDPFDYTLLALLKVESSGYGLSGADLGHLLFYVRHFPHLFKELSFGVGQDDQTKVLIFKSIVSKVVALEETDEYKIFRERFLEERGVFRFNRRTELKIPAAPNVAPTSFPKTWDENKWSKSPFRVICETVFTRELQKTNLPQDPPFLDRNLSFNLETLEADLVEKFKIGYESLKTRETYSYTLHPEKLNSAYELLHSEKKRIHQMLVQRRKEFILKVNTPYKVRNGQLVSQEDLFEEIEVRNRRQSLQSMPILPELVMKEVILRNDASFLKKHCPLLKPQEINQIIRDVCDYYHLLVLYQVCEESLGLIEKIRKNLSDSFAQKELASRLDYQFLDPQAYPEISYFKVTEGKLPRQEQAEIYTWVCEGLAKRESRLFQHKAGGGKTDYLTPLIMLRAKREGLMPVFFSTQMIYSVDRENLSATLKKLDDNLCYLEVGMHMKLSGNDMRFIYGQLQQYHSQGRGLIMTPQIYFALRLQYYFAGIMEEDEEKVKYLSLILNFFQEKCFMLGDEAHHNCDPLTRAIFGVGKYFYLPKEENALFLELLKPLLGFEKVLCDNGQTVSEVSRLEKNLLGTPSGKDVRRVQLALAKHMSQSALLKIPEEEREAFILYWTDKKCPQPQYLLKLANTHHTTSPITQNEQDWDLEKRLLRHARSPHDFLESTPSHDTLHPSDLIALTGYFILDLLPQLVKMRTELDHSRSIFQEEEFDTPCHHKTASTAQYEDPYLSSAVSIKGTSHRSLSEGQIRKLVMTLVEKDWKEQSELGTHKNADLYAEWVKRTPFEHVHLRDISLSNPKQMEALTKVLARHPLVVEYYLTHFILPQIGYAMEQLTCTPAHLLEGFNCSILFTATPYSKQIYPRVVKEIRYDPLFEAEVVTEFCKAKNQKKIFVDAPETFFAEMQQREHQELFKKTSVLLDPAGFYCDEQNGEIAKKWLLSSDLDGVFYFKEGRSLNVNKDERVCLLLKEGKNIELEGSNNLKEALATHKLDWDKLKLGTYFDASHTESANILQKVGTTALIYVADNLTVSRLIQALMRLRGLLDEKMIQSVVWVYPKEVARKIPHGSSNELDGAAIFAWSLRNEVKQMKKRIVLAAFQEISIKVETQAAAELKHHLHDPKKQIQLMKKYSKGFLEKNKHDPYGTYAEHEHEEETQKVLMTFAKESYARFGYSMPFHQNRALLKEIESIIRSVEQRIQKIATSWGRKLSLEVEQHTKLKKDAEQENYRPRPFDPISAMGIYGNCGIDNPDYLKCDFRKVRSVFKTEGLTDNFYFELNQTLTAQNAGESMGEKYLKPIDFFEIVIPENGNPLAIVTVNEIISSHLECLAKGTENEAVKHKAFLVSAEGRLIQKGNGVLAPPEEMVDKILKSQWMQDLVIDAALLRGQIVHPDRLLERIKKWPNFPAFWNEVIEAQPNPETVNRAGMTRLIENTK